MPIGALVQDRAPAPGGVQIIVGVLDRENSPLIPLPFEWERDAGSVIEWGGDRWYVQPRILFEPPLTLIGAAPLTPFEQPLLDAARSSLWILLLVSVTGLIVASVLTGHMTRGLDHLADAAEEVAAGALDRRVDEPGARELGRLARAFNRMTASLQATLKQLRRATSARPDRRVRAASLAHEVRNPLTAIRVDLQVAEEGLAPESPSRPALTAGARRDRPARLGRRGCSDGDPRGSQEPRTDRSPGSPRRCDRGGGKRPAHVPRSSLCTSDASLRLACPVTQGRWSKCS